MAKGSPFLALAAGLGDGYMGEKRRAKADTEREQDRAMRLSEHEARMDEVNRGKDLQLSLANAARPVSVQAGAGGALRPESMDNRDVGLAENAAQPNHGLSLAAYRVGSKNFNDQAEADREAAKENSAGAVTMRLSRALASGGKPAEAMELQARGMQITAAEQAAADKALRGRIDGLQTPDDIAGFISSSPVDGQQGAFKVKARQSADGSSFTLDQVGADGKITPTRHQFTTDPAGIQKAKMAIAGYLTPEQRMEHFRWEQEQDRKVKADDNKFAYQSSALEAKKDGLKLQGEVNEAKAEAGRAKVAAKEEVANMTKNSQLASFDTMLVTLDRLGKHPGLSRSVGVLGALPTMPGSDSANFQAELNTFQSQAFIPMVAQLKGMGALSDAEGKKLTQAVGALDPKMGEKAFRESVGRITTDMAAARERMAGTVHAPAGGGSAVKPASAAPANVPRVASAADAMKLPPGTLFVDPNGVTRRRP